jgi:glycosyltransferase involved in cell wall biosynthesis
MKKLILDDKLRDKFASKLYETVRNKFSWDVTAKKIIKDIRMDS